MKFSTYSWGAYVAWGMTLVVAYYGLGSYPILDNNEGLYAQIAREMALGGNWVIPHLNGVPYLEKPPLVYWMMALSFKAFGVHEWSARLVPSTSFALQCLLLFWFGRRCGGQKMGLFATAILATCWGASVLNRMIFFDGWLATWMTATLLCTYVFFESQKKSYLRLAAAALAAAIMTKGLVALILYCVVIVPWLYLKDEKWADRFRAVRKLFDPWACFLLVAITLPWHLAASFEEPGFLWFYIVNEHVLRFLDLRLPRDYYQGSWYYYLVRLPAYLLPWTFFLFVGRRSSLASGLQRFLWCWVLGTLLFFTLSRAKANYYMIVGVPPLVLLLAGGVITRAWGEKALVALGTLTAVGWGLLIHFLPAYQDQYSTVSLRGPGQRIFYKDYEALSSALFYHDGLVPIVESESHDLAWGAKARPTSPQFISGVDLETFQKPHHVIVRKGRAGEFEGRFPRYIEKRRTKDARLYVVGG